MKVKYSGVYAACDHEHSRNLFATISLGNSTVKFQLDNGATCNLLPAKYLEDRNELTPTRKWLTTYNDTVIKPLGTCTMEVLNPNNSKSYHVEFEVVDSDRVVPNLETKPCNRWTWLECSNIM